MVPTGENKARAYAEQIWGQNADLEIKRGFGILYHNYFIFSGKKVCLFHKNIPTFLLTSKCHYTLFHL
jgi:hypothetical protein